MTWPWYSPPPCMASFRAPATRRETPPRNTAMRGASPAMERGVVGLNPFSVFVNTCLAFSSSSLPPAENDS